MSRSYKKTPVSKDSTRKGPTYKSGKQIANRAIRHIPEIPNGGGYRKAYDSYNISDFAFRMDENELKREWEDENSWIHRQFQSYKQAHFWWKKCYQMK